MKTVGVVLLCLGWLHAADMEALRSYKQAYKDRMKLERNMKIDSNTQETRMIVVRFKDDIVRKPTEMASRYSMQLTQCMVKKICLFKVGEGVDIKQLIKRIEEENSAVESVWRQKKYHFNRL